MSAARGIFFDADDARAVSERLLRDGYAADVVRERLAGEDDDEDHPWAVTTDAPDLVLELLVDEFDGWFDVPETPTAAKQPVALPAEPSRIKRTDKDRGFSPE